MKQFIISEETLKAILTYLAGRPYQEVFQGIQALQQLNEAKATTEKDEE
jgi:hypothetical protein